MSAPATFLIPSPEGDLHQLSIRLCGEVLLVHSNNRDLCTPRSTSGLSPLMAQQLIDGLSAVLAGAPRAVTPCQHRLEQEEVQRRERRALLAEVPAPLSIDYDNLFGDS